MIVQKSFGKLFCNCLATRHGMVHFYPSVPYGRAGRFERAVPVTASPEIIVNDHRTYCFPQRSLHTGLNVFLQHHMMRDEWSVKGDTATEEAFVVNIWTRAQPAADPVLVFIHGSGDCNSGTTPIYDGANLAAKGVVVVTITYRIGKFGYLPVFDGDALIANLAYFDQQLALRWVRKHIAEFGGDVSNITLMGHSGGALAVNHHYMNETSAQYFDKCILCGGPVPSIKKEEGLRKAFEGMLRTNGCANLADLKALNATRIIKLRKAKMREVLDGEFFQLPSETALKKAAFTSKPMLIGSNADELSMIELPLFYPFMDIAQKEKHLDKALHRQYGFWAETLRAEFADEAEGVVDLQMKIMEALIFHHSVYQLLHIYGQTSPVYGYRLNYVPNLYGGLRGAYHGAEVALFFDNMDKMRIVPTKENRAQTARLQEDWIAFMRSGKIPSASPYQDGGKIISYDGSGAAVVDFPHAAFLSAIGRTNLPNHVRDRFLTRR